MADQPIDLPERIAPELIYKFRRLDVIQSLGSKFIVGAVIIGVAWIIGSALEVLAGKQTLASIAVTVIGNIHVSIYISWTLTGGAILYAWRERKFRQKKTKELAGRIQKLESKMDPDRTSSELDPTGKTKKEDR